MAKYTVNEVADCILKFYNDYITNLKLQKFLYYSQAWNLALRGKPLFDEDFQAWVHGPVEPVTYQRFKRFGFKPIIYNVKVDFDKHLMGHVKHVLEVYGEFSGFGLERQTQSEPPWMDVRGNLPSDQPSIVVITKKSMLDYYSSLLVRGRKMSPVLKLRNLRRACRRAHWTEGMIREACEGKVRVNNRS
jgi:uncharacterized phage-associated protein